MDTTKIPPLNELLKEIDIEEEELREAEETIDKSKQIAQEARAALGKKDEQLGEDVDEQS